MMLIVIRYYCLSALNADKALSNIRSAKAGASPDAGNAGGGGFDLM